MTDAPERIWAVHWNTEGVVINGAWADTIRHFGGEVEYVRADVSRAAVEAAYIAGLDDAPKIACKSCAGTGQEDDAGCGDISFNTWTCRTCGGSGRQPHPEIRALKDPAHVRAAVAKLAEGRG